MMDSCGKENVDSWIDLTLHRRVLLLRSNRNKLDGMGETKSENDIWWLVGWPYVCNVNQMDNILEQDNFLS